MMERKKRDDDKNNRFVGIQCEIFRCITLSNPANDRHETKEFNEYHRIYLDVKYICNDEEAFEKNQKIVAKLLDKSADKQMKRGYLCALGYESP